ncbi:MAG: hypothetical protein CYPHOPRED_005419 [Cyphobasidiales sp. Tagirdzhanova-0007]|nr:MAG: hypothetical protein CYPHOPRED_005419 [Cyphobasidiales sp. Tagirdzhanova-0007]
MLGLHLADSVNTQAHILKLSYDQLRKDLANKVFYDLIQLKHKSLTQDLEFCYDLEMQIVEDIHVLAYATKIVCQCPCIIRWKASEGGKMVDVRTVAQEALFITAGDLGWVKKEKGPETNIKMERGTKPRQALMDDEFFPELANWSAWNVS